MKSWRIIADSSSDLLVPMVEDEAIKFSTVPLKVLVDQTEYVDNSEVDVGAMITHLRSFKGPSSSACPSIEDFAGEMRKSDYSIVITITSGLSGTYNCALMARDIVLEESPDKRIHVLDTHSTSSTMILDVYKAKELIAQGLEFEQVVEELERYNKGLELLFVLASYDTLIKNGRMSAMAGLVAKALNIRAIATNSDTGTIEVIKKTQGETNALKTIAEMIGQRKDITGLPVVITHCFNEKGANTLKEHILQMYQPSEVKILPMRALAGYYAGEGGLILSF